MINHNLLPGIRIIRLSGQVAAGVDGAFVTSLTEIDTQGYTNMMVVTQVGTVVATGVITSRVKASDTSATYGSGTIDMIGSAIATSASAQNGFIVHDVKVTRRYHRFEYQRTVANSTLDAVFVILYNAYNTPVANASVLISQVLNQATPSTS